MGASPSVPQKSVHDFTVKDCKNKDVELSIYKGKVLLIVNVASKCEFTNSNYTELTELYSTYKRKDFEILAFPCNQFLNQEPGTSEDAQHFACTRFKAEYPVFQKVRVNGQNAAPIYKFLKLVVKMDFLDVALNGISPSFLLVRKENLSNGMAQLTRHYPLRQTSRKH